jgi:hypothetical protein
VRAAAAVADDRLERAGDFKLHCRAQRITDGQTEKHASLTVAGNLGTTPAAFPNNTERQSSAAGAYFSVLRARFVGAKTTSARSVSKGNALLTLRA